MAQTHKQNRDSNFLDLDILPVTGHQQVNFYSDKASGLRAIVAIHSTALGPALGGTRMRNYDTTSAALQDALIYSRAMSYKASLAGVRFGGASAVILGDPAQKTEELLKAFARRLQGLNGSFRTAPDIGMTDDDMRVMEQETEYVIGSSKSDKKSNPALMAAFGVFEGIKAAVKSIGFVNTLKGLKVAVQGLGNVGRPLVGYLSQAGATVFVAALHAATAKQVAEEFSVEYVDPHEIYSLDCDVFSPCAVGGILNSATIARLKCDIVAGAANNQLATNADGDELFRRGIVHVPDYAINAGGLIAAALATAGATERVIQNRVRKIHNTVSEILLTSQRENIRPYLVADRLAEERIEVAQVNV
jgi:leucine dehydrogenase